MPVLLILVGRGPAETRGQVRLVFGEHVDREMRGFEKNTAARRGLRRAHPRLWAVLYSRPRPDPDGPATGGARPQSKPVAPGFAGRRLSENPPPR